VQGNRGNLELPVPKQISIYKAKPSTNSMGSDKFLFSGLCGHYTGTHNKDPKIHGKEHI